MTTLSICRGPRLEIVRDESYGTRWCFHCRLRTDFRFRVRASNPTRDELQEDPWAHAFWGAPRPSIECSECGAADGDCGFGRAREWDWDGSTR